MTAPFIEPDWPAPGGVLGLSTTREGGCSAAPFASLNLGHHVGDDPVAVAANRRLLLQHMPADSSIQWLDQVHGVRVATATRSGQTPEADASICRQPGVACAVLTADCLPVLLCDRGGTVVAAAHAGWRGLVAGVLEATIEAMAVPGPDLLAWLGPAIGPAHFEVGLEVREQFLRQNRAASKAFTASPLRPGHFLADLYQLARLRLQAAGVAAVYGAQNCTYAESGRFYSYRRDGQTGRMASLIMLTGS